LTKLKIFQERRGGKAPKEAVRSSCVTRKEKKKKGESEWNHFPAGYVREKKGRGE